MGNLDERRSFIISAFLDELRESEEAYLCNAENCSQVDSIEVFIEYFNNVKEYLFDNFKAAFKRRVCRRETHLAVFSGNSHVDRGCNGCES